MIRFTIFLILSLLLGLTWGFGFEEANDPDPDSCITPNGLDGKCINLEKCPELIRMLKRPVPTHIKLFLRKSVCAYKSRLPDVCCPIIER